MYQSCFQHIKAFAILFFCGCIHQMLWAQHKDRDNDGGLFLKYADAAFQEYNNERPYYITVWERKMPAATIVRRLTENAAIIKVTDKAMAAMLKHTARVAVAKDSWKLSPPMEHLFQIRKTGQHHFILTATDTDSLLVILKKRFLNSNILCINRPSMSVLIQCSVKDIQQLLQLKEVLFVDERREPKTEAGIIGYNRSFNGINAVDYAIPGANGKNIAVGVKEQQMEPSDLDLYNRILPSSISAANKTNHATVVASLIGGAGNSFYDGRGIAWGCRFFPSSFANLFADDDSTLTAGNVSVQNHSYGTVVQQFYGAEALSYDAHTWSNKNFVHVFSAGNKGQESATEGKYASIAGYANLTGNFKMAKNIITVGAVSNTDLVPGESAAGPMYDGRMAPQLVALGPGGTSDAAAVVSGTVAVMQQVYADSNSNAWPPASLVKAVLYNTADDIYTKGIDYKTGFGMLNSFAAIKALQQKKFDAGVAVQNQQWLKIIAVPLHAARIKVTLAWTDTTASVNNNKALTNDLDLELKELSSGIVYYPWGLNTDANKDSLAKEPVRRRDSLNTSEQVSIDLPAEGNWEIKVKGIAVNIASQPFNIAYSIDTLNHFLFTNPQHTSDVNIQESATLAVKWEAFVADTNQTAMLFISYDNGAAWQMLNAAVKLYSGKYEWPIKDTSSAAQFKMEISFGIFLSKPFVISKVCRPEVGFVCADSFGIYWGRHVYASSYKLYALTDSPYLKHILTVTDTTATLQHSLYPWKVYAVEPVLSNGIPAARSIAFDIEAQGVYCFYKALNYNLLDGNRLNLRLDISAPLYTDSVYFERVTAYGILLETFGGIKTNSSQFMYEMQAGNLPTGTIYIRSRIVLKSGAIVYTDIIPVFTAGKNYVLFYPNPARHTGTLQYVLQQGVPTGHLLQLFDITGRLLASYTSVQGNIDMRLLPKGLLVFKLTGSGGVTLQAGKLVVD